LPRNEYSKMATSMLFLAMQTDDSIGLAISTWKLLVATRLA
jgi:hypothetical protein